MEAQLASLESYNNFLKSRDEITFSKLKEEIRENVKPYNSDQVPTMKSSFIKDFYNFIRSPEFPEKTSIFIDALKFTIQLCDVSEIAQVQDTRTVLFICRKAAWALLKQTEIGNDPLLEAEKACEKGKSCAIWLLKTIETQPNLSLIQEIHGALLELEIVRILLNMIKEEWELAFSALNKVMHEFKTCPPNVSKNTCEILFKITKELQRETFSESAKDGVIALKCQVLKPMFEILVESRLDKNQWLDAIEELVYSLVEKGHIDEAKIVCYEVKKDINDENMPLVSVLKLAVSIAENTISSLNSQTQEELFELLKMTVGNVGKKNHFKKLFKLAFKCQEHEILEGIMFYVFETRESDFEDAFAHKAMSAFIDMCIQFQQPKVLIDSIERYAGVFENCQAKLVKRMWKFADEFVSGDQNEMGKCCSDEEIDSDSNNNNEKRQILLKLTAVTSSLAMNCEDLSSLEKAHLLRQLANLQIQEKNFDQALVVLEQSHRLDSTNPFVHYLIGQTCIFQADFESLQIHVDRICSCSYLNCETKIDILANFALKCFETKKFKEGTELVSNAIFEFGQSGNDEKVLNLCLLHLEKGECVSDEDRLKIVAKSLDILQNNDEVINASLCESFMKVSWNCSVGVTPPTALQYLQMCAKFCEILQKYWQQREASQFVVSRKEVLMLRLKCLSQSQLMALLCFRAGDLPDILQLSSISMDQIMSLFNQITSINFIEAEKAKGAFDGGIEDGISEEAENTSAVDQPQLQNAGFDGDKIRCEKNDLEDLMSFVVISRVDILFAMKQDACDIIADIEKTLKGLAILSPKCLSKVLLVVASSAEKVAQNQVELHCRDELMKVVMQSQDSEDRLISSEQAMFNIIRYTKLVQITDQLLSEDIFGKSDVASKVIACVETLLSRIVVDKRNKDDSEFSKCNEQLQWLMVKFWNCGLSCANKGRRLEAVKLCNFALSIASKFSKWPRMLAYQQKMRTHFSQALMPPTSASPSTSNKTNTISQQ